jgi:hypothetical protein
VFTQRVFKKEGKREDEVLYIERSKVVFIRKMRISKGTSWRSLRGGI